MKTKKFTFGMAMLLLAIFTFVSLCSHALAQPTASANAAVADELTDAINLLNEGKPQEASKLIATIPPDNPEYPAAQCYQALCLYELKDFPGFLKQMESPAITKAAMIPDVGKDLALKYIDALFKYRKFEQLLPQIELFQNDYPDSPQLPVVAEYQMATLFERGMKKAIEAGGLKNQNQFDKRWTEAQTNLKEFLSLASSFQGTNYSFLSERVLKEEVWSARITLADDQAALADIPAQDTAARARFSFLRIQLAERLHRDRVDQNLQLMADYLGKFPESDDRKRVEFNMAEFSFRKGEQLSVEANAAEQSGDTNTAGEKRASASQFFEQMRSLQSQIVTNRAAGIEESDVLDSREDLLYSYYLEKNYGSLLSLTSSMISESKPGDMNWIMGKLYTGIALTSMPGPKTTEAAVVLDEVLALGFKNKPQNDHYVLSAAKWRIYVAQRSGDKNKAVQLVLWVYSGNCTKNIKTEFLKTNGAIAGLQKN
jgi:hypothetical protein